MYLKETGVGSSRKQLIPKDEADQLVLDEISMDPANSRGPRDIKETLALRGQHIPRYAILQLSVVILNCFYKASS